MRSAAVGDLSGCSWSMTSNRRQRWIRHGQRGLALITALLVVAIVATIAAYLSLSTEVWIRQVQNLADRSQAEEVRDGALALALKVLDDNAKQNNPTDNLTQEWARALPPMPVANGTVVVRIFDAQSRFNLNNLMSGNVPSQPDIAVFQNLLRALGIDPSIMDALLDWIGPPGPPRPDGAQSDYYLTLTPPYRAANQPLQSVEELRLVRGFNAKIVEALRPYVVALPVSTPVNINTADAMVLSALFTSMSPQTAQTLVAQRDNTPDPFTDPGQLQSRAGQAPQNGQSFDVKTSYYIVDIQTSFGRIYNDSRTLVYSPGGAQSAQVLWQSGVLQANLPKGDTGTGQSSSGVGQNGG